jgi:hypothetical protein
MNTFTVYATRDQIATLLDKLKAAGASVLADEGPDSWAISGHGVEAVAQYAEADQILQVSVIKKPWYVSIGVIESQLKNQLGMES